MIDVKPAGIGGGALGFSKLPSWFCGNLGLEGGDIIDDGDTLLASAVLMPRPDAGLCLMPLLLL